MPVRPGFPPLPGGDGRRPGRRPHPSGPGWVRYLADDRGIPTGRRDVEGTEWDLREGQRIGDRRLDTGFTLLDRDGAGRATVVLSHPGTEESVSLWMDAAFTHLMIFTGDSVSGLARRRRGLAVEPVTAAPDAFNSGDGLIVLQPGQVVEAAWGIKSPADGLGS